MAISGFAGQRFLHFQVLAQGTGANGQRDVIDRGPGRLADALEARQ